jgi:hypothetical protein
VSECCSRLSRRTPSVAAADALGKRKIEALLSRKSI